MRVDTLSLEHFRNYSKRNFSFDNNLIIIEGDNAAGKTNLLEALTILSVTKSPRASKDDQLVEQGFEVARVFSDFTTGGRKKNVCLVVDNTGERIKKIWRLQKVPKRPTDIIGALQVVLFRPDDLNLLITSPSERRNYLDLIIARSKREYLTKLNRYKKILTQRKAALEILRNGGRAAIEVLNTQLVSLGAEISFERYRLVKELKPIYTDALKEIAPKSQGDLQIINACAKDATADSLDQFKQMYQQKIVENLDREIAAARNLVGPQREDLNILLNQKLLRDFGSRGEWRSGILALKKSEAVLLKKASGEWPVLLLDDVTSELDEFRQKSLTGWIKQQQTFITTTCLRDLPATFTGDASVIKVGSDRQTRKEKKYALA